MTWQPDYVDAATLKSYLDIEHDASDVFVGLWVTASSRNVDDFCGRQFGQVAAPEARTYEARWDRSGCGQWVANIDDLQDVTGFALLDEDAAAVTDYTLLPVNAAQKGKPFERLKVPGPGWYTPTGRWGWSAVPASVKLGLLLQASRLAARQDSPFGIAGSPTEGSEVRLLAQLDPDFRTTLKPFRRDWWAA